MSIQSYRLSSSPSLSASSESTAKSRVEGCHKEWVGGRGLGTQRSPKEVKAYPSPRLLVGTVG